MIDPRRRLGQFVRLQRLQLGMSQEELADRIGRSQNWVSRFELGITNFPDPETLERLAGALNVSVRDLLAAAGYDVALEEPTPPPETDELTRYMRRIQARHDLDPTTRQTILTLLSLIKRLAGEEDSR